MKRAIDILPSLPGYVPFDVKVKEPGTVRGVVTGFEPPSLVIPASMGKPPESEMKPLAAVMFEVDPDGAEKMRHFLWLPAGSAVNFPGELKFRATYVDEVTGTPLILYEAIKG